ncbi:MAG: Mut7-C RNAse domain-containing protein [Gammaproteobacteria bacterium]|nr:MAG: Mut7-C RNAse domain-containing protein [Gammaproteobacteria bacterium]
MPAAHFRFYEELNDFLAPDRRKVEFIHTFKLPASIKDMIESLGVPHTEIDMILVNGKSVDFTCLVQDKDHISVYPVFETLDITPLVHLRPKPLRKTRFIVDANLGRLARYLRLIGFDTIYNNDINDIDLVSVSLNENRIILTRDIGVLKRSLVTHGYFVRATNPRLQLLEVIDRLNLHNLVSPFSRCTKCNGDIQDVALNEIEGRLPKGTKETYHHFKQCQRCGQIYWGGPHYRRMRRWFDAILEH